MPWLSILALELVQGDNRFPFFLQVSLQRSLINSWENWLLWMSITQYFGDGKRPRPGVCCQCNLLPWLLLQPEDEVIIIYDDPKQWFRCLSYGCLFRQLIPARWSHTFIVTTITIDNKRKIAVNTYRIQGLLYMTLIATAMEYLQALLLLWIAFSSQ